MSRGTGSQALLYGSRREMNPPAIVGAEEDNRQRRLEELREEITGGHLQPALDELREAGLSGLKSEQRHYLELAVTEQLVEEVHERCQTAAKATGLVNSRQSLDLDERADPFADQLCAPIYREVKDRVTDFAQEPALRRAAREIAASQLLELAPALGQERGTQAMTVHLTMSERESLLKQAKRYGWPDSFEWTEVVDDRDWVALARIAFDQQERPTDAMGRRIASKELSGIWVRRVEEALKRNGPGR